MAVDAEERKGTGREISRKGARTWTARDSMMPYRYWYHRQSGEKGQLSEKARQRRPEKPFHGEETGKGV